jgi:hypothetical protein
MGKFLDLHRVLLVGAGLLSAASARAADSPREIVVKSISADNDNIKVASHYTFREHDIDREFDSAGRPKTTRKTTEELLFLGGKPFEHLIEKDDKPLPPDQEKKEQAKLDKATAEASRLTDAQREKRLADFERQQQKDREILKLIPDAYDFKLLGDGQLAGRNCWMILADPKPGYHGKYAGILRNMKGKIWIDQSDYQWVRLEALALNDVSFGLFIARLSKGSSFVYELSRVNDEVWLPKVVTLKVNGRALVKHFNVERETTFTDYRKYQASSRIVAVAEEK